MPPLQPLADVTPQPTPQGGDAGAASQPTSFRERKMMDLQGEAEPNPGRPEEPGGESAQDGGHDDASLYQEPQGDPDQDYEDDDGPAGDGEDVEAEGALFDQEEQPDGEDAEPAEDDDGELTYEQLNDKYQAAIREISKVTENRKAREQELSDGIAANIATRHQLEDLSEQAIQRAGYFLQQAEQRVQQFANLNWSQVPPDQVAELQQQAQQAQVQRDQLQMFFNQAEEQGKQAKEAIKQREAEVSRAQLINRIPDWGQDAYQRLRDHATANLGFTANEFNELTDWRIMMLVHNDLERQSAVKTVRNVKRKQKAKPPRNRNGRIPARNAQGQFQQARDHAHANPGDRNANREMFRRRLESEDRGRR